MGTSERVQVLHSPETKWVEGSNYVDIGFKIDERTGRIIMMGAIDNLVKGAAGQAVQNMNLMFGLPESEGLELVVGFRRRKRSTPSFESSILRIPNPRIFFHNLYTSS